MYTSTTYSGAQVLHVTTPGTALHDIAGGHLTVSIDVLFS